MVLEKCPQFLRVNAVMVPILVVIFLTLDLEICSPPNVIPQSCGAYLAHIENTFQERKGNIGVK